MLKENHALFKKYNVDKWQQIDSNIKNTVVFIDMGNKVFDYIPATFPVPSRKNYRDDHVAGVTAVFYQVDSYSNIIVFTPANTEEYDNTFAWIREHKDEIDLINISMSMSKSVTERMHIPEINNLGIPIICSAGNQEDDLDRMKYPALYDFSITVGSYNDEYGRVEGTVQGEGLTCVAPYKTNFVNSKGNIANLYGTSFATPFVTGCLSLYIKWRKRNGLPKLSNKELQRFVVDNSTDIYNEGFDIKSGYGLFRLPSEMPIIVKESDNMTFKDTEKHWAKDYINFISDKGLMKGYADGTFKPDEKVTRAELATVLARMNGFVEKK